MKKLLLILLCLPMIGFGQGWEVEYLPQGYDLNTIYFYSDSIGYAVGDNGAIVKTTDGGENWIDLNSNTTNDITDIMFISEDTGYICTKGGVYTQTHGEILTTYNGGNNWSQLYQGSIPAVYQSYFKIEKIVNGDITIIGYENWFDSNNTSISYGRRFNYQISTNLMNQSSVLMNGGIPYDSYSYSSNSYTLVGGQGMPIGGASWSSTTWIKTNISGNNINVNFPTGWVSANSSLYSIDMLDANPVNGIAVGSKGKIINLSNTTSTNNIVTVNSSFTNQLIDLWAVDMMNDKGWIVGDLGTILFTVDSGQTWSQYNIPTLFQDLHSVLFTSPCKGYFVGNNGVIGRYLYDYEENISISICEDSQDLDLSALLNPNAINLNGEWSDVNGDTSSIIDPSSITLGEHEFIYGFYLCNVYHESIVNLTINEASNLIGTSTETTCDTYTWNDSTYSVSGIYTWNGMNSSGCDSSATLDLTVLNSTSSTDTHVACNEFMWNCDGNTYTSSNNTATYTYTNVAGCDSIVTLDLTINYSSSNISTQSSCDSYTWNVNGQTYYNSGIYTDISINSDGCEHIDTLILTIFNSVISNIWQSGNELFALSSQNESIEADWYNIQTQNNLTRIWLMVEDTSSFSPTFDCSYFIVFEDENGCIDTSDIYSYGANAARIGSFTASPNPTSGQINVSFENNKNQFVMLELLKNDGTKLDEFITIENNIDIDLSQYASGTYYLYFNSNDAIQGCRLEEVQKLSTKIILNK